MIADASAALPPPPTDSGALVVLTSGTTGTPKGAQRPAPKGFAIVGGLLAKVPYRSGEATYIAPPMFHGLGLLNTAVAVYNLYGSTEAAYATIATPEDLRAAPSCVGRAPFGTTVRIFAADGRPVPTGQTGTVYVDSVSQSTGYTGGGKPIVDGLMSTGDVCHLDTTGRLFIDGRDDDMVVSGGENVFPGEVADLLSGHPDIGEVAVLGVPDDVFGQALRAFVVRREGRAPTEDDVKAYVKANLARYKVLRSVVFLDALPRNPTGKVLARELLRRDGDAEEARAAQLLARNYGPAGELVQCRANSEGTRS